MKKKIKKGVELLSTLLKKQHLYDYIKPLAYSFRAYGYFCQSKYTHSLHDLETLEKQGFALDSASQYNKLLLEGLIATLNNKYEDGLAKFSSAESMRPAISDTNIYKSLTFITMFNRTLVQSSPQDSEIMQAAL